VRSETSKLDSQPRVGLFSLEYTQLLTKGKNLEVEGCSENGRKR
jgi:hypothetical protein